MVWNEYIYIYIYGHVGDAWGTIKIISKLPGIPGYRPRRNNLYSPKAT